MAKRKGVGGTSAKSGGMGVLRGEVVETVINTLREAEIRTPTSVATRIAMRIWHVYFDVSAPLPAEQAADSAAVSEVTVALSTQQDRTTLPSISDPGTIASSSVNAGIYTTDAAGVTGVGIIGGATGKLANHWDFGPRGLLVVDSLLSLYVQAVNNRAGQFATGRVVIFYTLEELDADEFFMAASLTEAL